MTADKSTGTLSTEKRALLALKKVRAKLDALEQAKTEPIAIIGMGCRFPGRADTPERFWEVLYHGIDTVTEVPKERWDVDTYYQPELDHLLPGQTYCRSGSFLEAVEQFDAHFFGISPREAIMMDPQQRLLLEVSWEALEYAGMPPSKLMGSNSGVFVGIETQDYFHLTTDPLNQGNLYTSTGGAMSVAAGRLAYVLGLHGPTLSVDTSCSASLVAVHLACQSLRLGECDLALAGGVSLTLTPHLLVLSAQLRGLAPDGRCKTFDAAANGTAIGEGCGMIVLKRLSDAQTDRDNIIGLIPGSALNHDGRSSGLSVPNGTAQKKVIRQALENSQIDPSLIGYVEAHGTGTPLGDPIEIEALGAVFNQRTQPLVIGSAKSQIGHLMSAAGIAGLIKVLLAFQHEEIPPQSHFQTPNPVMPWETLPLEVATKAMPFPSVEGRRLAGVSSFGVSGTNAHMILEAYDNHPKAAKEPSDFESLPTLNLLTLSAKTKAGLVALTERYEQYLAITNESLHDICFTANSGRTHFDYRTSIVTASITELREKLQPASLEQETIQRVKSNPQIAFLFTGQGSQYMEMGRELYENEQVFRQTFDRCDEILRSYLPKSLSRVLYPEQQQDSSADFQQITYSQMVLFTLEYALAKLWESWGIQPNFVIGHSTGEYVAACVAGVFSLEDALKLLVERSKLILTLPENGEMLAVLAAEETVAATLEPDVALASVNGPRNVVISGEREAVYRTKARLAKQKIKGIKLNISRGGHSPLMEPILEPFKQIAAQVTYHRPKIGLISNVTGKMATDEIMTPEYWCRHTRETVRFASGIETIFEQGCDIFVETGPKPTLMKMCPYILPEEVTLLPSLDPNHGDLEQMLSTLGDLYRQGISVNWEAFSKRANHNMCKVVLPTYPFQHQRYWVDTSQNKKRASQSLRPMIDKMMPLPLHQETVFETELSVEAYPFLADHQVYDAVVSPGACHLAMVLNAAELAFGSQGGMISDIILPQALVVPKNGTCTAQLVFKQVENVKPSIEFQLLSFASSTENPFIHATGQVAPQVGEASESLSLESFDVRCPEVVAVETLYQATKTEQILLGPSFRWLSRVKRGEKESFGKLQLPETINSITGYAIHPGLLDACFQVAGTTLRDYDADEEVLMPFAIEKLRLYQFASGQEWWCHAQQIDTYKWNIQLFDIKGQLIADISGFEERIASPAAVLAKDAWHDWLYEVVWQPTSLPSASTEKESQQNRQWLLMADQAGVASALAALLRTQGEHPILVYPGHEYAQLEHNIFEINPESASDYQQLLEMMSDVHGVVHLWSLDDQTLATLTDHSSLETCLETTFKQGSGAVLLLTQTLLQRQTVNMPPLWLVTQDAQAVDKADEVTGFSQSSLWGLGRTIALEHPELHCVCLDFAAANESNNVQAMAEHLLAEISLSDNEQAVAYRQGIRHVARLVRGTQGRNQQLDHNSPLIKDDASYLITGGLGNLGLKVAHWLVEQGARYLVLMSRRGIASEAAEEAVKQLEQAGANVLVVKADISNPDDVAQAITDSQTFAPLRGIIHAAVVLDDGMLINQSLARFEKVMAPKATGGFLLHQLTKDLLLDFFVHFSSDVSLLGSTGQGNYAAASAFMDGLVHHRRALGLPALSINWGAWGDHDEDNQFSSQQKRQLAESGARYIPTVQGLQAMGDLMKQDRAQMAVIPMNWSKWLAQYDSQVPAFFKNMNVNPKSNQPDDTLSLLQQLESIPHDQRRERLIEHVQSITGQVLGYDDSSAKQIDLQQNVFEFGMNSITAIELRNRLRKSLECSLPATLAFSHPTVEGVVNYLAEKIGFSSNSDTTQTLPHNLANNDSHDIYHACLIKIQPHGNKRPLFFVAGMIGVVFNFYPLGHHFDPEQPFYALQSPGLDGEIEPYTNAEDMAAHYIKAIQTVQPQGPYLIGGYSSGGRFAIEIVRQLQEQGHEVSLFVTVDIPTKTSANKLMATSKGDSTYLTVLSEEFERVYGKKIEISSDILDTLTSDEQLEYFLRQVKKSELAVAESEIRQILPIMIANAQADSDYVIPQKAYPIPIALFKAEDTHPLNLLVTTTDDPNWGWDRCSSKPIDIHVTPGDHFTMLMEPHVQILAERMQAFLDKVQRTVS